MDDLFGDGSVYEARLPRIFAASEARAEQVRLTARPCEACGKSMLDWPGRKVHFSCEPNSLAGKRCVCRIACSASTWGNGPTPCDPECIPCRIMRGVPFSKRKAG